ncbi:uncharacterized protein LOC143450082 [Clavelina lepadiformis]|uniref:uncharacterized protein LOC143450082 n=1 Tax=Clavelina lepadiformis TaxID=159417 RepID=UPI0040411850
MKISIILLSCALAATSANSISSVSDEKILQVLERQNDYIVKQKILSFSSEAKAKLRYAALTAIAKLCFHDDVPEEILNTVCARAASTGAGKQSDASLQSSSCFDCTIADPICFLACPQ